ncbi:efflux RND transporter periplasmic adaptor subunit [Lentibacillus lipolyticus]|nr:efflux RND transporter periplasmic adaptor subunit [Lentibacillus lipolyticus]
MRRRQWFIAFAGILLGVNGLLIFLDDEGEVARLSYVQDWSVIAEKDMTKTIDTPGVLTANQLPVYFDKTRGSFQKFLVEEGTTVRVGEPLYTYNVDNYAETKTDLEQKKRQLTDEIRAVEEAATSLSAHRIPEEGTNAVFEGESSNLELKDRSVETNYLKERDLAGIEMELAQKRAQLESIQMQLSELETDGETVTVASPYAGSVTELSESLDNPVVTIRGTELYAQGKLTEAERMEVEKDMPAEVTIRESDTVINGALGALADNPETLHVDRESTYSFQVTFDEQADTEDLLPGYHADVAITTAKSVDVPAVKTELMNGSSLWKMTSDGTLKKQTVKTGVVANGYAELTKGAEPGEWAAANAREQLRDGTVFITPLKLHDIEWKQLGKYDNVNWKRCILTGLLAR